MLVIKQLFAGPSQLSCSWPPSCSSMHRPRTWGIGGPWAGGRGALQCPQGMAHPTGYTLQHTPHSNPPYMHYAWWHGLVAGLGLG